MGRALPQPSLILKIPYRFAYTFILRRHFFFKLPFPPLRDDFSLCRVDVKLFSPATLWEELSACCPIHSSASLHGFLTQAFPHIHTTHNNKLNYTVNLWCKGWGCSSLQMTLRCSSSIWNKLTIHRQWVNIETGASGTLERNNRKQRGKKKLQLSWGIKGAVCTVEVGSEAGKSCRNVLSTSQIPMLEEENFMQISRIAFIKYLHFWQ